MRRDQNVGPTFRMRQRFASKTWTGSKSFPSQLTRSPLGLPVIRWLRTSVGTTFTAGVDGDPHFTRQYARRLENGLPSRTG
jgi:hypothetical protein